MNNNLEYKGYYAAIHFNDEEEMFHGKITGIDDLINFEASSTAGIKAAFHEAVEDYLLLVVS